MPECIGRRKITPGSKLSDSSVPSTLGSRPPCSAGVARCWLGLTAEYTTAEDVAMSALKRAGGERELEVIHTLKALLGARIVK